MATQTTKKSKEVVKSIYKSLADFQQECPVIHKATKGYGYSYSDLPTIFAVINPLLKKNSLGFTQLINGSSIETILFHIETGETITSITAIPEDVSLKGMNQFQVLGSAVTYIRRYALSSMLGIVTDKDTDASGEQLPKKKPSISNDRFEKGVEKVANDEITKQAFLKMLEGFELSELQQSALKLL
tara:strand:- start:82 stop:639 length:558 start_codon:yes stop_codon:yes gene_type:complete